MLCQNEKSTNVFVNVNRIIWNPFEYNILNLTGVFYEVFFSFGCVARSKVNIVWLKKNVYFFHSWRGPENLIYLLTTDLTDVDSTWKKPLKYESVKWAFFLEGHAIDVFCGNSPIACS